MSTSRLRRALCALLALGLTGSVVLTSSGAAADRVAVPAANANQWLDASGVPMDAHGYRADAGAVAATGAATTPGKATATAAQWSSLGPPGGDIYDIAASTVDPNVVLAGFAPGGSSGGGLYRSSDGGATWSEVATVRGKSVFAIEFTAAGTVYIGTQDSVWRSDDGGLTWVAANLDIGPNDQVLTVAVAPSDASVVWVGIGAGLGAQKVNVMRSTDGGTTWTNRTPPFGGGLTSRAIAVAPADADTVVATFEGGQVWVTGDGGGTWTNRSAGLPRGPIQDVVYDGSRLLVAGGQLFQNQYLGLYQSTDLGATWTALHDSTWPVPVVDSVAVDPTDSGTLLVATAGTGVHRSTDGGATWQVTVAGTAALTGRAVRFRPGSSEQVLLGADSRAVFRSTDGGASFTQSANGISEIELHSVHANPRNPREIAIAFQGQNAGGVFSTVDGGVTWNLEPVPPTRYSAVRFAPDGTLYAISSGPSTVAQEGLYRRGGDGKWTVLGPDQGTYYESDLKTIRFSDTNPDLILLAGADFGYAGNEATIWRSLDRGGTWTKVYEGAENQVALDIEIVADGTGQEMVASVRDMTGPQVGTVLRSEDGGATWWPSMIGLPGGRLMQPQLCASSHDPRTVYVAGGLSLRSTVLFRSDDGGVTWESTGWTGEALVVDLACDPVDGRGLYLLQNADPRVVRSEDGGTSFSPFSDGIAGVRLPVALAFADPSRLLMASGKGSYVTELVRDAITLSAAVRRDRHRFLVDLSWQGATATEVDVYRDGVRVATVPNDGSHFDVLDRRGSGTATYQVCRADSSTCSTKATVRFGTS